MRATADARENEKREKSLVYLVAKRSSMKIKHAIILIAIGYGFDMTGALMKIMHWPLANIFLSLALLMKLAGIVTIVVKLVSNPRFRDFLNQ